MHAEGPRFVAGRRDDAACRAMTHGHGLAAQRGIVTLLDRRIERVHVYMDNLAQDALLGDDDGFAASLNRLGRLS